MKRLFFVLLVLGLLIVPSQALCQPADTDEEPGAREEAEKGDLEPSAGLISSYGLSFGGQYRVMFNSSAFGWHSATITDAQETQSLANQRLRTWINFHDTEKKDHGVYLQLEIGHTAWGEDFEFTKTHGANENQVGIELRRGYLWYKPCADSLLRVGVLDWHDRFGERPSFGEPQWAVDAYDSFRSVLANSIWDFNVGGIEFEGALQQTWHYRLSALILEKGSKTVTGDGGALLLGADMDGEFGSSLFGTSLYYIKDNGDYSYGTFGGPGAEYGSSWDLWAGIRGHLKYGRVTPSLFLILNTGETSDPDWKHSGWAVKAAVGLDTSVGKFSLQTLYATGDDGSSASESGEFRTIAQSERDNFGAQGYWSFLGLTSPHGPSDVNDLGVGLQNRGLGLFTIQASVERKLTAALSGYAAIGLLRSAEDNPFNGESDMGIEILGAIHWTVRKQLGFDLGASYLSTGNYYKAGPSAADPDNVLQIFARYQLEF